MVFGSDIVGGGGEEGDDFYLAFAHVAGPFENLCLDVG
jgi:hypothetical protein